MAVRAAPTAAEWWPDLCAAPATFGAFVAAKLVWYNMEAVLVQRLGAVWAAVSGIALIAPAWAAELVAGYNSGATWGERWTVPASFLQLLVFASLALGVSIYNGLTPLFDKAGRLNPCGLLGDDDATLLAALASDEEGTPLTGEEPQLRVEAPPAMALRLPPDLRGGGSPRKP